MFERLLNFFLQIKYSERVSGLILVSPIMLKELLIHDTSAVCGSLEVPESEIVRACRKIEKLKLVIKEFFKEKDEEKERLNGIIVGLFAVNENDKVDEDTILNRMS
ncbi:hypothetical protein Hanom_Chr04g00368461 [Helianthus anomalus]